MAAKIIDGKAFAATVREQVAAHVARLKDEHGITPGLAVVLVGEDPASQVYVRNKGKQTVECGMQSFEHKLDASVSEAELLALAELLHNQGELTPTLLFRCACTGDLDFLSAAFQVMCEEEAEAVVFAFYAQGEDSFRTLYQKAGLSPYFRYAITAAVKVVTTRKKKGLPMHPEAFVPEIVEKIIRFYRNIGPGTVENVIGQLKREAQRADQRG